MVTLDIVIYITDMANEY